MPRLLVDSRRCIGCFACHVACQQENSLEPGCSWVQIVRTETGDPDGRPRLRFASRTCRHCTRPACLAACAEGAISKLHDGLVVVSREKCNGCLKCVEACRFKAVHIDLQGKAGMCTVCSHRAVRGLAPACVVHCAASAISVKGDFRRGMQDATDHDDEGTS